MPTNLGSPDAGPGEIFSRTCAELRTLGAELIELSVAADPFGSLGPVQFYTDALSYAAGDNVHVMLSTLAAGDAVHWRLYRTGWYGGAGG